MGKQRAAAASTWRLDLFDDSADAVLSVPLCVLDAPSVTMRRAFQVFHMATNKMANPQVLARRKGKPLSRSPSRVVIPNRLAAIRALKGWNQVEAAQRVGISAWALRALETGESFGLAEEMLLRIADVYGCALDQIFGRKESGIERFASASPEVQSAQLHGLMSHISRLSQNTEVLAYIDEIVAVLSHELPTWEALQAFRGKPAPRRMAILNDLISAFVRIARDPEVIKYLGALVMRFAQDPSEARYAYSVERDEHAFSHTLTNIERMFGRGDPNTEPVLTPSRFKVTPEPELKPKTKKTSRVKHKKKVAPRKKK